MFAVRVQKQGFVVLSSVRVSRKTKFLADERSLDPRRRSGILEAPDIYFLFLISILNFKPFTAKPCSGANFFVFSIVYVIDEFARSSVTNLKIVKN